MHKTEITESKQVAAGQFSLRFRCCGNAKTDSWITLGSMVINDSVKLEAAIQGMHSDVAADHQAAQNAVSLLAGMVGTTVEHS